MLNPDFSNQNSSLKTISDDILNKSELYLFNFSKLNSKLNLTLSQNNSFNYDFSEKEKNELKNEIKSPKFESIRNRHLRRVKIDLPSWDKLMKDEIKNDFINNYDDSFAKYCGLDKEKFSELFLNNRPVPTINEFGDIYISINNIANVLKNYSHSKKIKITRKKCKRRRKKLSKKNLARNKYKKLFKINKLNEGGNDIKQEKIKDELNNNFDKERINNDIRSIQPLADRKNDEKNSNNNNEHQKSKALSNIKKNLKNIIIPGKGNSQINTNENNNISNQCSEKQNDNDIIKKNIDSENIINPNEFNDEKQKEKESGFEKNLSSIIKENILSNQSFKQILKSSNSTNYNNIFNFPSNIPQNYFKSSLNKSAYEIMGRQAITPFIKNNNSLNMSLHDDLNNIIQSNRPILSPMNFNPNLENINNILSPKIYEYSKDKISSPFFANASPFSNNNFNENFIFNNSSFLFDNSENNNDNNSEELFNNNQKNEQINNEDIDKNINNFNDKNNDNNSKKDKNHIYKNKED